MTKKSRKAASRYSELSKEGKRRQRHKRYPQPGMSLTPRYQEIAEPRPSVSPISKTVAQPHPEPRRAIPGYQYVSADLKRIGIIAGAMVAILIVLAFILG